MKNSIIIILTLLVLGCSSDTTENTTENTTEESTNSIVVADFLRDISTLEKMGGNAPITEFKELVKAMASKVIEMDKDNIEATFNEAKNYKYCVIITGNHTIVKITSFDDCKVSSSWGTCMPFGEGYIKKGELVAQEDYINNIIGRPDSQQRTVYLFE